MTNTIKIAALSFFLLVGSNAFAVQGPNADRKEINFLVKMEQQLEETQVEVRQEIAEASDAELMDKYGDVLLEMIFSDSAVVQETGISVEKDIRTNVELLFSDDAKNFLLDSAEAKLEEFGSLKAFKKQAKKAEKALKSKHKGLGRALVVVASYIVLPFFLIFGPWGWVYWSVLFGYWS